MKMFRALILATPCLITSVSHADVINVPPEMKEKFQQAGMALVMADMCDKRLDMPELRASAVRGLVDLLTEIDVDEPEARAFEISEKLANEPQSKETAGFSIINPAMCQKIADGINHEEKRP